jgi:hypothetical protein
MGLFFGTEEVLSFLFFEQSKDPISLKNKTATLESKMSHRGSSVCQKVSHTI